MKAALRTLMASKAIDTGLDILVRTLWLCLFLVLAMIVAQNMLRPDLYLRVHQ